MASYKGRVISIRIDDDLLRAVRERAMREGRSLSGEIVFVLRDRVKTEPQRPRRPITGWLRHLAAPETHAEFRSGRQRASTELYRAVRRKANDK
jgi:hypothetical protein